MNSLVLARFIRTQISLADRPPAGRILLNNTEAATCAEALEKNDDLKTALAWVLSWWNPQTALQKCRWEGRGHAPQGIADTIDALCCERWANQKTSETPKEPS
jgi:hypothetical protein